MEQTVHMKYSMTDESSKTAIAQFVIDKYEKHVIVIKKLPSFEDINILLQSTQCSPCSEPPKFVLKIFVCNEQDEKRFRKIQCFNFLKSQGILCSKFIPGLDGNYLQTFAENGFTVESEPKTAALYSFLDGKELEHTGYVQYPMIISELGSFLAHFHSALKEMPEKEALVSDLQDPWNLHNYRLLLAEISPDVVKDDWRKQMLKSMLEYVVETLDASRDSLFKGVLHGDFHGLNIIVDESYNASDRSSLNHQKDSSERESLASNQSIDLISSEEKFKNLTTIVKSINCDSKGKHFSSKDLLGVYGIIDFDSVTYSYTVLEIGRLIADVMVTFLAQSVNDTNRTVSLSCQDCVKQRDIMAKLSESSKDHLRKIGGYVLAGYLLVGSLSLAEVNSIYAAMLTSLCQYYLLGSKAALYQPDSEDYVAYCSSEAISLLEFFSGRDVQNVVNIWLVASEEILNVYL